MNTIKKYFDLKLFKIIAFIYGIIATISYLKRAYIAINGNGLDFKSYNWFEAFFYYALLDWLMITPYMIAVSILTKIMFEKQVKQKYIILFHLLFSIITGWLILITQGSLLYLINKIDYQTFLYYTKYDTAIRYLDITFLSYLVLTGTIYIYHYIDRVKEIETQKTLLSNQLVNSKMNALKAQLQPHFLFNTLNGISALIESNTKQAQNTLADLSDLLREILDLKEDHLITLQQELSLLKKYLDIILIRFSDHLKINVSIDPDIENALMPSMLLQPIAENAFKHGFSYETSQMVFDLNIYREEKKLIIKISNDGKPLDNYSLNLEKRGTGLNNIRERLQTLYGSHFEFKIYNNQKGVTTKISIPLKMADLKLYTP